jgi:hypothetical protein
MTKTKIALIAALLTGTSSVAFAQGFDPNPANRGFPQYAAPGMHQMMYNGTGSIAPQGSAQTAQVAQRRTLQSAPVRLQEGRSVYQGGFNSAPVALGSRSYGAQQDEVGTDLRDRASSPYAGGVN